MREGQREVDPGCAQHRLVDLARHFGREEHDQPVSSAVEQAVHAVEQAQERKQRFGAVMGLVLVLEQAVHILKHDEEAIQLFMKCQFCIIITITHATELVLQRPGFFWPSYHLVHNSNSHVAD